MNRCAAHIERRDGLWFPLLGLVEAVLWFQPFNHRVAACFRQSAELACDDRAVQLTGAPSSWLAHSRVSLK